MDIRAESSLLEGGKMENKRWKPKVGELYYFIDQCWEVKAYVWEADGFDDQQYELGNVFQTYEQAKQELDKIKKELSK